MMLGLGALMRESMVSHFRNHIHSTFARRTRAAYGTSTQNLSAGCSGWGLNAGFQNFQRTMSLAWILKPSSA